jgi:hypothetical protein
MKAKEKAEEIFTHYHNLIQDLGGELGQEILVSILARQCALYAIKLIIEEMYELKTQDSYDIFYYWVRVEVELQKM